MHHTVQHDTDCSKAAESNIKVMQHNCSAKQQMLMDAYSHSCQKLFRNVFYSYSFNTQLFAVNLTQTFANLLTYDSFIRWRCQMLAKVCWVNQTVREACISPWTLNFLQSIDSRTPLQELSMFSKQTQQPVQESRPGPGELHTGIACDSCFLLCNYTQLLFLREGILVL